MVALANGEAVATPGVPAAGSVAPSDIKEGISFGDRGEDVKVIQRVVGETPDGYFGSRTYAAVRQWQRFNGLVDDGIVGPLTWARMTHQS
jgi:peptidoglycan hydrolase-like protein with peptidoglycan-binding domain